MSSHTPGPWHVGHESGADQQRPSISILRDVTYVEGVRPTTYRMGEVTYPTTTGNTVGASERRANARLISAAPELLKELQYLVDWVQQGDYDESFLERPIAAIVKATGSSE